jgi:GNAT superfamily N-acetyltransferase
MAAFCLHSVKTAVMIDTVDHRSAGRAWPCGRREDGAVDSRSGKSNDDFSWEKPASADDETVVLDSPHQQSSATLGGLHLLRLLGRGGMGEVWLARDPQLERHVAVKTLRRELSSDSTCKARFLREARAVARLNHPNIILIHTVGEHDGTLYLVMEFVDGESLSARLGREGPLALPVALDIARQVAHGLGHALANGVIHRDVKPGNILLDPSGRAKIADFGLAKLAEADNQMTVTGTALGTPFYMSPEAAQGAPVDHRADIYSLGVTLFHMLAGTPPFTAPTPGAVLVKHIRDPLPEPESLRHLAGGAVLEVIKRMTAKAPADRFQTYEELDAALRLLAAGEARLAPVQASAGTAGAEPAASSKPPDIPSVEGPSGHAAGMASAAGKDARAAAAPTRRSGGQRLAAAAIAAVVLLGGLGAFVFMRGAEPVAQRQIASLEGEKPLSRNPRESGVLPPGQPPATATPSPAQSTPVVASAGESVLVGDIPPARASVTPGTANDRHLNAREIVGTKFDFDQARDRLDRALAAQGIPAGRREELIRLRDMVARFAQLRAEITARAQKPGVTVVLNDPQRGRLTMTTADSSSFVFRDESGDVVRKEWSDLRPGEVMDLVRQLMGPGEMDATVGEFYGAASASALARPAGGRAATAGRRQPACRGGPSAAYDAREWPARNATGGHARCESSFAMIVETFNIEPRRRRFLKPMLGPDELPPLLELEKICFPPPDNYDRTTLKHFLSLNGCGLLRWYADTPETGTPGPLVAFHLFDCFSAELITLDVHPDWRRRGIGSSLLRRSLAKLRSLGHRVATCQIAVDNEASLALHKRFGFHPAGRLEHYYGSGRDAFHLVARL